VIEFQANGEREVMCRQADGATWKKMVTSWWLQVTESSQAKLQVTESSQANDRSSLIPI